MPRTILFGAVLITCTLASAARAADEAILPGESRSTGARLVEVRKKIADKYYSEAIDELQAILETAGNDLVPMTKQHCVQARRLCHRELALLPPEALKEYRSRVEPQARKWLEEATPARDVRPLRRVVDEAFCTRSGETALDLLGDLAFERGRFEEAIVWWRFLAPPLDAKKDKGDESTLVYPDPQGDKAKWYAKQIVAHFFAGAKEEANRELKLFQKEFPSAEGTLAGRKGKYVELLQVILKAPAPKPDPNGTWTTFGGDATRGLVVSAPPRWQERLARTVKDGPTWRFDLEKRSPLDDSPPVGSGVADSVRARALAFHPLICGHYVIVADARFVTVYDLNTGKATDWYDVADPKQANALALPNLKLPTKIADLRYTLTAADDCLYVRFGAQSVFLPDEKEAERDNKIASFISCLSLDPAAKTRVRWITRPVVYPTKPVEAQGGAIFEGTPVVSNGFLYVAVTWFEGDRTVTAIQCYPAGTETEPQKRWQRTICETRELKPKEQRPRHHLLTIAGPNVVYCSHSGAIVAVDALTGKTAWAVRYPSQPPTNADEPSLRDLTPCVYTGNRLYAAPADYDHLLCLDPLTGETFWDREHLAATHLLGVGKGRLLFTTLTGLRAVNAVDGSDAGGWVQPDGGGKITPMGRGFLIEDVVVWPTDHGVFVRRQEDGAPADPVDELKRVPAGNLVFNNGVLAVADRTTLSVFVPPAMQLDERREQTKKNPDSPVDRIRLMEAELDVGIQANERHRVLKRMWELFDWWSSVKLPDSVEGQFLHAMSNSAFDLALRHDDGNKDQIRLERLFLYQSQCDAVTIHRARISEANGQWQDAAERWRSLLDETVITRGDVVDEDGVPRRVRYVAERNLARLGFVPDKAPKPVFLPPPTPHLEDTKNWSLPWERSSETMLPPGTRLISIPGFDQGIFFTDNNGRVHFDPHNATRKGWEYQQVNFHPTMGWIDDDRLILTGSEGLVALNIRKRDRLWTFSRSQCSGFQFAGGRIFFLENDERLFAVDAATGNTLWAKWAPGAKLHLAAPLGHFHPHITPLGNALLVQPTPGRLWLLDAATGKVLHEESNRFEPWPRAPVVFDDNTALVVLDSRTVALIDGNGKRKWKHVNADATTATGEAPQLIVGAENIVLLTANNLGYTLQRLDAATGKPLWEKPPLLETKTSLEFTGGALDRNAVYYAHEQVLTARSLADGKFLWQQALPEGYGSWRTRRVGDAVLAYPAEIGARQFQFRWQGLSVQWEMDHSREVGVGRGLPVICCDAKSGRMVQRLNLLAGPPRVRTRLGFLSRAAALSRLESAPQMLLTRNEMMIAIDSTVWRYSPAR